MSLLYYQLLIVSVGYTCYKIVINEFSDSAYGIFGYNDSLYCFPVQVY